MNNRNGLIIGILIFLIIAITAIILIKGDSKNNLILLKGKIGGEKIGLLENKEIISILSKQYKINFDYAKAGSIEMVKGNIEGLDFLWPSSQVALELFNKTHPYIKVKSENIFNSPIVLYSWDIITEALMKINIVKMIDNCYYIVDFPALIKLILDNKKWEDIGITELYGKISIISTDPAKSNSGNMFAGLLANILNNGDVVDETKINVILPQIKSFFNKLGFLEHSSGDLFMQFLKRGVGDKPIIVGYESQIIEFVMQEPSYWQKIKSKVRILYPVPTVWSSHPVICLNSKANILINALKDEKIQQIAWKYHGFRTGFLGVQNDPKIIDILGIPENITKVVPMPKPEIMEQIVNILSN